MVPGESSQIHRNVVIFCLLTFSTVSDLCFLKLQSRDLSVPKSVPVSFTRLMLIPYN